MTIPPAHTVNYSDPQAICGYQILLCKMYERAGGFECPRPSGKEVLAIRREGMVWLKEVKRVIDQLFSSPITMNNIERQISLSDIPQLLASYDFFYRVCHGAPCFPYLSKIRMKAVNRYVQGDKSISQAQVALMLCKEACGNIRQMEQRYLDFSGSVVESWVNDLEKYGKLRDMPLREAYDVLSYLLKENLFAYISNPNSKLLWIKAYTLKEEQIEALDTATLKAYIGFEQAVARLNGKSVDEEAARFAYRFSELSSRPDLHPFFKAYIALDLARSKTA